MTKLSLNEGRKNRFLFFALYCLFFFLLHIPSKSYGQLGINTDGTNPDASAMLDVVSTDKGMLVPRMTVSQRDSINTPATGLMIFQTDGTASFYYYTGSVWQLVGDGDGTDDQNISGSGLIGTTLTIGIEGGTSESVELAGLQDGTGTDDQTLSEILAVGTAAGGYKITNLADPTMAQDAATKAYVDSKAPTRKVGDIFDGGIVFFVAPDGSGLMASLDDLDGGSGIVWWPNNGTDINNAESMTDGKTNTDNILTKATTDGIDPTTIAAGVARNHNGGMKTDWYLPSNRELALLASQDILIDRILDNDGDPGTNGLNQEFQAPTYGRYWSSTEISSNSAWYFQFPDGFSNYVNKSFTYRVRAIRAFSN